ncbi:MAG: hypothetical protein KAI89_00470 [Emcibacter sp.]|nr:hypothetical protein [Emcibacter sp.]
MEMALDIVIIVLIVIMIAYSVVLNIKLKTFRNAQNEMSTLIGQLNGAITGAQASVEILKKAALTEEVRLKELIVKSRLLADELEIITQSGSNLADRIERGLVPGQSTLETEESVAEDKDYVENDEMLETLKKVR